MLLPTNDTGSYYGQVKGLNTDEINLYTILEVTGSTRQSLVYQRFGGVNVISFEEQVTGSTIRPILRTAAPVIHTRAMASDNVTIKLRDITSIELTERTKFEITNYIEFK